MKELIEWRVTHEKYVNESREIVLHFDGREYVLGTADKYVFDIGRRFFWRIQWDSEVFNFMDDGYYQLRTGAPLEPYQEKMNEYIITNLWRIVRRLKEIEGEKHSQVQKEYLLSE